MNTLTGFLLVFVAGFLVVIEAGAIEVADDTRNYDVSWECNGTDEESLEEKKLMELRIQMVKLQILSKLNMTESSPSVPPPSESSRETIRLLLGETEDRLQQEPSDELLDVEERLVIPPKGEKLQCFDTSDSNCKLFQYALSSSLNTSTVSLWVYKTEDSLSNSMSVSVSYSNVDEEKSFDKIVSEIREDGWNKLELSPILLPPSWNETFMCSIELTGDNFEDQGDHRPFLMVFKSSYIASRRRREISCDSNESCCLKALKVSFADIGLHWVLYPMELQVNVCVGKCRMDHSTMRTHYERAMTKILEKDSALRESLGECWKLCCKPKQLSPVRVIYNDTEGIIHDQYIPKLTVSSCSCS